MKFTDRQLKALGDVVEEIHASGRTARQVDEDSHSLAAALKTLIDQVQVFLATDYRDADAVHDAMMALEQAAFDEALPVLNEALTGKPCRRTEIDIKYMGSAA